MTDDVVKLVKESGFDYIDKHAKGGNLWIISEHELDEVLPGGR